MLTRSRSGHLKSKQGCSQQHALHLAEEAKKKEKQKQQNMAFFMGTELQQITKSIGKLEQSSQVVQQEPTPKPQSAEFRAARTPDDLLRCFSCLRKAGDFMWCSVCAESPQNGLLLEANQLPRHGNWDVTQEFSALKDNVIRHMEGDKSALHQQKAQAQEAKAKAEAKSMAVSVRVGKIAHNTSSRPGRTARTNGTWR